MLGRVFSKFCSWMEENPDGISLRRGSVGAILIEFSIAVPVLFTLIYYIHDLPRYKQLQERMSFAAHEIASALQNIARIKGSAITSTDLNNAVRLANLSVFPGKTQYSQGNSWTGAPLGYISVTRVHYVEGTGPNKAEIKWYCRNHPLGVDKYYIDRHTSENYEGETKIQSWGGKPEDIYPSLKLAESEAKIIVEHRLETNKRDSRIFGLYLIDPLKSYGINNNSQLFNSIVIFSPVPGAFSATVPG